ncbi:MAG: phosphate ABC transporter substrate-binding protein PstS [Solirubrobacteraceae bacterium]|nr:phosphate ABC transporter substrate-binding protein PstS [Solirubrobacteraceae bacterium]
MTSTRLITALAVTGSVALGLSACGDDNTDSASGDSSSKATLSGSITGAGATFPQPVYTEWAADLKEQGLSVNYQGVGSGGGIAQFTAGTVDFGATDSAMDDDELKAAQAKGEPVHIPSVFGAVTVSYAGEGLEKGIKLDGETTADIFLGTVKKWNDPKIASQNEGVTLPDTDITVCHRSDESGTTKLFTTYLAAYSDAWDKGPGVDKSVDWPTGTGAKGNDGVAACVKQTDGAVGYIEEAYALQNQFTYASLKNKAGQYIEPTLESTSAAGDGLEVPEDLRFSAINAPGDTAYPIASATFLLVYQDLCKAGLAEDKAKNVKGWLDYALGAGQDKASQLNYAPLPAAIHDPAKAKVAALECNGAPIAQ